MLLCEEQRFVYAPGFSVTNPAVCTKMNVHRFTLYDTDEFWFGLILPKISERSYPPPKEDVSNHEVTLAIPQPVAAL